MPGSLWRSEVEQSQPLKKHKAFTHTTSSASAETIVSIDGNMEEAVKVSLVVELADAYIEFDGTASSTSMLIPQNEGYSDNGISIISNISVKRSGSTNVRVRGIIWGF